VLLLAFVVAELFYKFHSFTLECAAFLSTWYVFEAVARKLLPDTARATRSGTDDPGSPRL
jgi:hypothetical protein